MVMVQQLVNLGETTRSPSAVSPRDIAFPLGYKNSFNEGNLGFPGFPKRTKTVSRAFLLLLVQMSMPKLKQAGMAPKSIGTAHTSVSPFLIN